MLLRLVGIALVLVAATVGWLILGATIGVRTESSDLAQREQLAAIWGSEQAQPAPGFAYETSRVDKKGPYDRRQQHGGPRVVARQRRLAARSAPKRAVVVQHVRGALHGDVSGRESQTLR
jgi:hypothetical protein